MKDGVIVGLFGLMLGAMLTLGLVSAENKKKEAARAEGLRRETERREGRGQAATTETVAGTGMTRVRADILTAVESVRISESVTVGGVTIHKDGRVEIPEDMEMDEASRSFWRGVQKVAWCASP